MRTTLLGSLLDVASRNLARERRARGPLRVRPGLPASWHCGRPQGSPSAGLLLRRAVGGAASPSRTASPASRSGRWSRGRGAAAARRPTSSPSRRCWRRSPAQLGAELGFEAAPEPFLHPGRGRRGRIGRRPRSAGSARSTRWSAASGTSRRRSASKSTLAALSRAAGARRGDAIEDVTSFPAVRQDLAVVVPDRGRRRSRSAMPLWRAAGSCCARPEVFDLYEGEQLGEGRKSLALRLEFRAPDRTLTDEEVAEPARARSRRELERDRRQPP